MKRKKECSLIDLATLYLSYIFNKITLIIFLVSLLFIILSLLFLCNPFLDLNEYIINPESYHQNYFHQGLFILSIFNGIIVSTLVILLSIQSNSFDSLFIGRMKRIRISLSKLIVISVIFLLLALFEFFILYLYPILIFPNYKIEYIDLRVIYYLLLSLLFSYTLSNLLSTIISSIFIPMVLLFIDLVKGVLISSFKDLNHVMSYILPILNYENGLVSSSSMIVTFLWISFFTILYILIYNIKDIKIN